MFRAEDYFQQDAFDLITGTWVPRKGPSSALFLITDNRPLIIRSVRLFLLQLSSSLANGHVVNTQVPYALSFALFMILAGLTLPRSSGSSLPSISLTTIAPDHHVSDYSLFYYFIFWFMIFASALTFIFLYGIDYVAWPRLLPPTDVIHYSGPGFRSAHKGKGLGVDVGKLKAGANAQWLARGARRTDKQMEEIELGTKKRVD